MVSVSSLAEPLTSQSASTRAFGPNLAALCTTKLQLRPRLFPAHKFLYARSLTTLGELGYPAAQTDRNSLSRGTLMVDMRVTHTHVVPADAETRYNTELYTGQAIH